LVDAIESFGTQEIMIRGNPVRRYKIFDQPFLEHPQPVVGQEGVQSRLVQILRGFARAGKSNKLIVLHGPNGSAKSTFVRNLIEGIEAYSKSEGGCLFHFSWVFPHDTYEKTSLGIGARRESEPSDTTSFAKLDPSKIGAIVRSELHENPIYLIPREDRKALFDEWIRNTRTPDERGRLESLRDLFLKSELSHKNALIFEALLNEHGGDFKKVVRHVRVERLYFSKRLRKGLVTVEPQFGVDASIRQVTLDRSMANLPPALQSLNLFQLEGDLIDGNRGIIEYNDFLKRPIEHFKYLLGTCETGSVNLAHVVAYLDTIFVATTDERHLEAFREHPEYPGFKSRLEFIKVPYLLRYSQEERIYTETARTSAGPKELMPHTTRVLALWAVLTRLKRPLLKNKSSALTRVLENLAPLAKAKLYDSGELPERLSDEERRELKGHLEELIDEQQNQPYYEGLLGASARELKVVLQVAAQNEQFPTLGPNAVLSELRRMVKRPMDFEYLRLEPNHGYHAFEDMIDTVRQEWLDWVDREMRESLGLQDDKQFSDYLARYLTHVTHNIRGEKIKNRITGRNEEADDTLMHEFENFIGVSGDIDDFRKNLISRLGAWTVEHPHRDIGRTLPYAEIFPDLMEKLRNKHHEQQIAKIRAMGEHLIDVNALANEVASGTSLSESAQMAIRAYRGLQERFHYGPLGAKEALVELIKAKYV
jgi:predicted Ser/Thr protein kinase